MQRLSGGVTLKDQGRAPLVEALQRLRADRLVPFDVPGHKRGHGNPELLAFLGKDCLSVDVNSMKPLDNLCHPVGVIKEAEELAAESFGAAQAFFMVGGTTSAVQAMILASVQRGEKIILPRNVHQSVINALILSGAVPVYVNPETHRELGISLGMSLAKVEQTMGEHPDAKAIFLNNPTYYGICSNLPGIVDLAKARNLTVLVDEAHGAHLYFGSELPIPAMEAGAHMAAVSMHKSGGSLTQSSLLLCSGEVNANYVRQIINLTQTTSGSYLLLSSLDLSRRNLALRGRDMIQKVKRQADYAREEINCLGAYYAYSSELINGDSIFAFDPTKLAVNTLRLGLAGIEVYDLLRDEYGIQIEFGDLANILVYLSVGDQNKNMERLISSLAEIRRRYKGDGRELLESEYINPAVVVSPQAAFWAKKISLPLAQCAGRVSGEFVISYPPGIPILAPGERVTEEIIEYIQYSKAKGCLLTGPASMDLNLLNVLEGEKNGSSLV